MSVKSDCLTPRESIKEARELWLSATKESELAKVEELYRTALRTNTALTKRKRRSEHRNYTNNHGLKDVGYEMAIDKHDATVTELKPKSKKKRKLQGGSVIYNNEEETCLKRSECRKAFERLALLLCQSGRFKKAKGILTKLGYECRLSQVVLNYPLSPQGESNNTKEVQDQGASSEIPCCVLDGFMTKHEVNHLRDVFESPSASYWVDHNYAIEPPSPYFSYVLPLNKASDLGFVGELILKIYQSKELRSKFPKLKNATKVEMWAHNRPHPSGHQMHFDSDDEGRDGIRNPIISTILYVTADCGGPSLITNQKLTDKRLATKGWMCHAKSERLLAFDGRFLHGVIPGKGVAEAGRRVTVMFAFWSDIRIRNEEGPGSARPFPLINHDSIQWVESLMKNSLASPEVAESNECKEAEPLQIDRIYETLEGKRWTKSMGMPEYDRVFQGF